MSFEMSPHILNRVEFRRISRQAFDDDASPQGGDVVLEQNAAINRRSIPKDHQFSRNVPLEVPEKLNDLGTFDAAGVHLKVKPPESQPADDRKAFPVESLAKHRRLSARRPGACPRRACAQLSSMKTMIRLCWRAFF